MIRNSVALLVLLAPPAARAQDMPLSQILIEGEGWKVDRNSGRPRPNEPYALSPDRGTVFYAKPDERFLFAYSVTPGVVNGESFKPYAPLRTRRGEQTIRVTGLTVDRDGRIYASTEIGVQVFDPTGRLCGVLTPAAQGVPYGMAFEEDRLTMWIGDTKYARKLNTAGAK